MTTPFYVHIVESLAPDELLHGDTPAKSLAAYLQLSGIPYCYNLVVDQTRLYYAFGSSVIAGMDFWGLQQNLWAVLTSVKRRRWIF